MQAEPMLFFLAHHHIYQHIREQNETCRFTYFVSADAGALEDCPGPGAGCVRCAEEVDVELDGELCEELVTVAGAFWAGVAWAAGANVAGRGP